LLFDAEESSASGIKGEPPPFLKVAPSSTIVNLWHLAIGTVETPLLLRSIEERRSEKQSGDDIRKDTPIVLK